MKERGLKAVAVWLDPRELSLLQAAAGHEGKKLATWIRTKAIHAAEDAARQRQRHRDEP